MANKKDKNTNSVLADNRKALHDYTVLERFEAGIELRGTEVKSCRDRHIAMADAYVRVDQGEAWLLNTHIAEYDFGNRYNHDPRQRRRLLLHKNEILKLFQKIRERGLTVVPLKFYLKKGLVKVEIALCQGKDHEDKRQMLRQRQDNMDALRAMREHR